MLYSWGWIGGGGSGPSKVTWSYVPALNHARRYGLSRQLFPLTRCHRWRLSPAWFLYPPKDFGGETPASMLYRITTEARTAWFLHSPIDGGGETPASMLYRMKTEAGTAWFLYPRFLQIRLGSESCDQISASPNRPKRAKSRDETAGSLFTRVYTLVEFSQTKRCFFPFLKQNIQRQMIHQHHYHLHNTIHISLKTR